MKPWTKFLCGLSRILIKRSMNGTFTGCKSIVRRCMIHAFENFSKRGIESTSQKAQQILPVLAESAKLPRWWIIYPIHLLELRTMKPTKVTFRFLLSLLCSSSCLVLKHHSFNYCSVKCLVPTYLLHCKCK